tara:strand:- start:240 stop:425 length:186 start_codon:yes stop_codon:yes gene_type:complete
MSRIKNKFFQRDGKHMIAGKVTGDRTLLGKGRVHRHSKGAIPHGLSKIEESIWLLQQKKET